LSLARSHGTIRWFDSDVAITIVKHSS
jgi:hypothetical protein